MCPVRTMTSLACPARFERATYALEALKMSRNNKLNNSFNLLTFGVQSAPRTLVLGGIGWMSGGVGRWSSGWIWDLSGKPTFQTIQLFSTSLSFYFVMSYTAYHHNNSLIRNC
jgi:hypothetical protein